MKRHIKRITQIIFLFFTAAVLSACGDADEEIFDKADIQIEQETDEEDEKKEKPGQLSDNQLFFSPISKTYQISTLS